MSTKILKYNPSFLTDDELIEGFVVRQATLSLLLEVVRDNVHETNQHVLVIGPRGSGKTTLLRRVAAAVRQTPELAARWFPLPFGEESYEVASAGQFWLEAVHHLGVQSGDPTWLGVYAELLREPDETRLGQRCLARLLDFADSQGKRLLLLVENLNLLFSEQISDDDAWALRATLMHEPRLMLMGSATSRFDAIRSKDKAMYELFRVIELPRLTVAECRSIWNRVTGQEIPEEQARAVQILTGGNPRLLTILSIFGAKRSFRSLLEDLSLLVDEHTDYFKSNFESLPPAERKVFACLATLWEDSTASDVAQAARMTTSQASSLLKRLEGRGAVKAGALNRGKKKYQLAERLYNIYYLMRRSQDGGRVRAVVNFMVQFYGQTRLHEAVADIAREACGLGDGQRSHHYCAMQMLCASPEVRERLERIRGAVPPEFLQLPDIPEDLQWLIALKDEELSQEVEALLSDIRQVLKAKRYIDAERNLRKALEIQPDNAVAWAELGGVLADNLDRPEEGADCLRKALELKPDHAGAWAKLGHVLAYKLGRPEEGADCLRKALEHKPDFVEAWASLGNVLAKKLGQPEEGIACLRKAVELNTGFAPAWNLLAYWLADKPGQLEESGECVRKALAIEDEPAYHGTLSRVLALLGRIPEALQHADIVLQHPDVVRSDIQESTDVLTTAAALGHGQEALDLLVASPSLPDLEPLAAGLRQYLGLDVQAPQEVKEIGEDIVKRIEHWKNWHKEKGTAGQKD